MLKCDKSVFNLLHYTYYFVLIYLYKFLYFTTMRCILSFLESYLLSNAFQNSEFRQVDLVINESSTYSDYRCFP